MGEKRNAVRKGYLFLGEKRNTVRYLFFGEKRNTVRYMFFIE